MVSAALFAAFTALAGVRPSVAVAAPAGLDYSKYIAEGQVAQAAGRLKEAADLFAQARKIVPENMAAMRGACSVALEQQREKQITSSREPCHRAMLFGAQAEDFYREVASMMLEPAAPSLDTTVLAAFTAEAAVRKAPEQPWGFLARCEIGRRLGLAEVVEGCLADLQRVAPASAETKRMLAVAGARAPLWIWALRILLVLIPLGTLAHFWTARARVRRPRPLVAAKTLVALLVAAAISSVAGAARAALVEKDGHVEFDHGQMSAFPIDDANPEASVPTVEAQNAKPLQFGYFLQDLVAKIEKAEKEKDLPAVIRYYRAVAKASPNSPYGPRKLCDALERSGDIDGAIVACRTATVIQGTTVEDFTRLIHVILAKKGALPKERRDEVYGAIEHLQLEVALGAGIDQLRCEASLRFEDYDMLRACTGRLVQAAPNDAQTVMFQWALALHDHDKEKAAALVDRARSLHMDNAGIARMEAANRDMNRLPLGRILLGVIVIGVLGAVWQFGGKKLFARGAST
jgi:hypothetical protein